MTDSDYYGPGERGGLPPAQNDKPTPEEIFENRKVNIYLTDANLEQPVNCLKGIRAVLSALVGERVNVSVASPFWREFESGERPVFLAYADGPEAAKAAAEAGVAASDSNIVVGYGLDASDLRRLRRKHGSEDPQGPEESAEAPDEPPAAPDEPDAEEMPAKHALVLMAMNEGSPTRSFTFAKIIAKNSGDSAWTEAALLIDRAFPQVIGQDVTG